MNSIRLDFYFVANRFKFVKDPLVALLINFDKVEYTFKIPRTVEEASQLIESGFDFVCDLDGCKLFRKRK